MSEKPSIPKGTRDFSPKVMIRRNYIFDTIKNAFQKFGYQSIETPAMEKTSTLMGKYGEEGDRLIFKLLPRGEKLEKMLENKEVGVKTDEALRYDLTVPFARFVVQHQNEISFPFKRYQIQPVWRADRPQKGRYREFYQCDADVVGSDSLLFEVEFVQIFDEVLSTLKLPDFTIKINNRKILSGIAEVSGESDRLVDITVAIDKLDKIGKQGVVKELIDRGISEEAIKKIEPLFELRGTDEEKLKKMETYLSSSIEGLKGVEELKYVISTAKELGVQSEKIEFDVTLARGLNYYTGAIFEVKANGVSIGSICGGGRYDNLTESFGQKDLSGVGISFGADRIYDVMSELNIFPILTGASTQLLIINFGPEEQKEGLKMIKQIREAGINAEIYPESAKMKKQMKYANDKQIAYVLMLGSKEIETGNLELKRMDTGEQEILSLEELINKLRRS